MTEERRLQLLKISLTIAIRNAPHPKTQVEMEKLLKELESTKRLPVITGKKPRKYKLTFT